MTRTDADGDGRLDGKVALVSGAGTYGGDGVGNGAATAILFARRGAEVALVDEELEWADATRETIEDEGGEAVSIRADVTDPGDCREAVERTVTEFGGLDVLHNNVGGAVAGSVVEADDGDWERGIDLNLMSMVYMARHAVPHMREGGGSIINVSSITARRPKEGYSSLPYTVTKTGVVGLTRGLALDHAGDGIRVNCIMPGLIWTPRVASGSDEDERRTRRESTPLPKEGEPWDVARAAAFLAGDAAEFVTGVTLPVDGGMLLTSAPN